MSYSYSGDWDNSWWQSKECLLYCDVAGFADDDFLYSLFPEVDILPLPPTISDLSIHQDITTVSNLNSISQPFPSSISTQSLSAPISGSQIAQASEEVVTNASLSLSSRIPVITGPDLLETPAPPALEAIPRLETFQCSHCPRIYRSLQLKL